MSDEELFADFINGRREALGELAARYEAAMLGLARGLLNGRRDLALDAVQETWMRVIRYRASFRGRSALRTWLYRIVVHESRRIAASRGRDPKQGSDAVDHAAAPAGLECDVAELRSAVAALHRTHREVVLLCYHAGLSHAQVAEILHIPLGTVKSRLHTALETLREHLRMEITTP